MLTSVWLTEHFNINTYRYSSALGGMVYTVDLKSAPVMVMGSSPIVPMVRIIRGSSMVERWSHKPSVAGSSPAPAKFCSP
jgi:hypothetical protein